MTQVRNTRDLRIAYGILRIAGRGNTGEFAEKLAELKQEIRKFNKRSSDRRIVKDNGIDGFVELVELPEYLKSTEDATEYFEEYEVRHAMPSMYDCTGQAFTSWFKVFKRHNKFFAYHSICFDV